MLSTIKNLLQLSIRDKWLFYKTISIGKLKMKKIEDIYNNFRS